MKKRSLKALELNKESISKLNESEAERIRGASLWYCDSEGLGCILETKKAVTYCYTEIKCPVDDITVDPSNIYSCECTIA